METEYNRELLEHRLANIEKILSKVEELLTTSKIQDRDIDDLKASHDKLDERCFRLEERCKKLEERCNKLEEQPTKAKADRWTITTELIYRLFLTAAIGLVLVKIGLS